LREKTVCPSSSDCTSTPNVSAGERGLREELLDRLFQGVAIGLSGRSRQRQRERAEEAIRG